MNLYEVKAKIQEGDPITFRARAEISDIDLIIGNMIPVKVDEERKKETFDFTYLDARMSFHQINPAADIWFEEIA